MSPTAVAGPRSPSGEKPSAARTPSSTACPGWTPGPYSDSSPSWSGMATATPSARNGLTVQRSPPALPDANLYDGAESSVFASSGIWYDTSGRGETTGSDDVGTMTVVMSTTGTASSSDGLPWASSVPVDIYITCHAWYGTTELGMHTGRERTTVPGVPAGSGAGAV